MRSDWRDTVSTAADLAIVGVVVTVCSLPVVTAGAAVHAGSVAVRRIVAGEAVSFRELWRAFVGSLLPGLAAGVALVALGGVLLFNLGAVAAGRVPGGLPVLVVTGAVAAMVLAVTALTVVHLGHAHTWTGALRWAVQTAWRQPLTAAMVAGVSLIAAVIGVLVPMTAPLLAGYLLFALHVVVGRRVAAQSSA
jgi:hypothetical protein